jgi:ABC-type transporter MlaC component
MRIIFLALVLVLKMGFAFANEALYVDLSRKFFEDLVKVADTSKKTAGAQTEDSKAEIKKASEQIDFKRLAEKSLGTRWNKIKKSEREEFLKVLQELLEVVVYPQAKKISVKAGDIEYRLISQNPIQVQALSTIEREKRGEIVRQKLEVVILFDKSSKKIVDAIIEGENISSNLKRQFDEALKKQSFALIIEKMRKKVKDTQSPPTT